MRILHLATYDCLGGACIASYRQHTGLLNAGVESSIWALRSLTGDPSVSVYNPSSGFRQRISRKLARFSMKMRRRFYGIRGEMFEFKSQFGTDSFKRLPEADIINIQFPYDFIDIDLFLRKFDSNIPIVITLHEMSPFTGGCSYAMDCERFAESCGHCPLLSRKGKFDYSYRGWKLRRNAYRKRQAGKLVFVANSTWTAAQAKKSSLLKDYPVVVIPLGLDHEVFRPRSKLAARKFLDIPAEVPVVSFSAASIEDERKGMALLLNAINSMEKKPFLLVWGRGLPLDYYNGQYLYLGNIESELILSFAYNASDVFVMPSLVETFGQTALEAQACGVPVVSFNHGGVKDVVLDNETGYLVNPWNVNAMKIAIEKLVASPDLLRSMSNHARKRVENRFTLEHNASKYIELYKNLLH